jgi:hypothetical protein
VRRVCERVEKLVVTTLDLLISQKPKMTVATVMHQKNEISPNLKHMRVVVGSSERKSRGNVPKLNNQLGTRGQSPEGGWGELKKKGIFGKGLDWSHGRVGCRLGYILFVFTL